MPNIISCTEYRELLAYRSTGMTPDGIKRMLEDCEMEPSPLPLIPNEQVIIVDDWEK